MSEDTSPFFAAPAVFRPITKSVIEMLRAVAQVDAGDSHVQAVTLRAGLWRRLRDEMEAQQHMVFNHAPVLGGPTEIVIYTPCGPVRILKGAE